MNTPSMPENPLFEQAVAFLKAGEFDRAVITLRRLLMAYPANQQLRQTLGVALFRSGDVKAGIAELDRAAKSGAPDALKQKMLLFAQSGDLMAAVEAGAALTKAIPDDPAMWSAYQHVLAKAHRADEAVSAAMRAYNLSGRAPSYGLALALAMEQDGNPQETARLMKDVLWDCTEDPEAWLVLGAAQGALGRFNDAEKAYLEAAERDPLLGRPWNAISQLRRFSDPDPLDAEMDAAVARMSEMTPREQGFLAYAEARRQQHQGKHDQAFDWFEHGAALLGPLQPTTIPDEIWRVDVQAKLFPKPHAPVSPSAPAGSPKPLFILGMPRSGTTLVERILTADSAVASIGEREFLLECCRHIDFNRLAADLSTGTISPPAIDEIREAGARYLGHLTRRQHGARWVIDKTPYNFTLIGLIRLALPDAVIVHTRRDPVDTCLSCFQQSFEGRAFPFSLVGLGLFYRTYSDLMAHWRNQRSDDLWEIDYETLVGEPETTMIPLFDRLGLTYDPSVLNTDRDGGVIRTASVSQARAPIQTGSVGRWRRHANRLSPLIEALGDLAPADT